VSRRSGAFKFRAAQKTLDRVALKVPRPPLQALLQEVGDESREALLRTRRLDARFASEFLWKGDGDVLHQQNFVFLCFRVKLTARPRRSRRIRE